MGIAAFTAGWSGVLFAYGSVQVPMWARLVRERAPLGKFLTSPGFAVPLTAMVGAGMAAAGPALAGIGITAHGFVHLALAASISTAIGYAGGRVLAEESDSKNQHQRGALVDEAAPGPARRSSGHGRTAGITLAGRPIAMHDEAKHFKLIGTTGTGKSTAIEEILNGALARGDRAVIADPDGGYLRRFYDPARGDVVLNPFDERSMKWDLFAEIKNPYDVEQLARSLIPDHEGSDRSWRGYARTFFSAVTRQMVEARSTDMADLYRSLVIADSAELRTLVRGTAAQPFLDEHNSRMFDSIRSVTSSAVASLDYISQQRAPQFSVRQWVAEERPGVLFLPYKAGQIAALRSTISGWMRLAIFQTMDREEQPVEAAGGNAAKRLWFIVDELDALGQIDGLKDALARLRKFGGRCVLGFQSVAQVSSTYGHGDAHTLVENCGNTLILRCSASEGGGTARFASQLIGEREVLRTTVSTSRRLSEMSGSISHSEHYNVEPAVLPSQIEQLPDLTGYLKQASDPRWQRVRLDAKAAWDQRRPAAQAQDRSSHSAARTGREPAGRTDD
jgi:type IV secretory pathway TraG/TraD family ATPase VirD4